MNKLILAAGATHPGQREYNEDYFQLQEDLNLYLVADGVGGHQAGDVASELACEVISREIGSGATVESAITRANAEVSAAASEAIGRENMATTIVAAHFDGQRYQLAWVGDSRAYLWDGQLHLLTRDHSMVQSLLDKGEISHEQALRHPNRNVILQALGMQGDQALSVGVNAGTLGGQQLLLLCSDGVSDVVDAAALVNILEAVSAEAEGVSPLELTTVLQNGADALVNAAVDAGGRDNITALLLCCAAPINTRVENAESIVWSYDPGTGSYSGLPEPASPESIVSAGEGPVAPRAATGDRVGTDEAIPDPAPDPKSHKRTVWLIAIAVAILILITSLGLAGPN